MKRHAGWDRLGISTADWADLALELQASFARGLRQSNGRAIGLLDWGGRYLPHYFRDPPSKMHHWLAAQLDAMTARRGTKLNVIGPRGGAKSTLGTQAYVLRAAVEGWEPYIWIVSDTKHQARCHLENIKLELAGNRLLREDYARATGSGTASRAYAIRLSNGVTIEAFGTGQRVRGRRSGAERPTLIVCDDLQNDGHMRSAAARESSLRWFEGTLLKAGTKRTNIVNLATALHRDALALRLHRRPGWTSQVFAAIERWPDNMSLWHEWERIYCDLSSPAARDVARVFYEARRAAMDAGAVLLWPEVEDLYTLMQMRVEGGRTAFEREKQGAPLSPDACEWPEEYFDEQIWFDDWPATLRARVVALDPSKGRDARRGDYSALVMLGIGGDGQLYVEADLARRPTPEIVAAGVEACRRFHPDAFGIETNQYQELLAGEFAAEFVRQGLVDVHPWGIDNHVSKQVRIRRLGPYLSSRRICFKNDSPGTRLLVDQLREFPSADHDDGPDALEMAIRLAGELFAGHARGDNLGDQLPVAVA
jgi:predicted phage terminase large subunit-like protein